MYTSYRLNLGGGFDIQITAGDTAASKVVDLLAQAMMLKPGEGKYSLLVLTGQESETFRNEGKRIVCGFPSHKDKEDIANQAMQVGLAIAHEVQKRGGILVHGGLAELHGQGVILAAPGNTGKTTASMRLPAPWRSLCDDMALICRDGSGQYYAYPWPTWSRFSDDGMGGSWDTNCAVHLKALYFLSQSPGDVLENLNSSQAAAMFIESVEQANRIFNRALAPFEIHENHRQQFYIVCELIKHLPAYRLHLSLTGQFWILIEASLKHSQSGQKAFMLENVSGVEVSAEDQPDLSEIVLSGISMYPTLKEPGFLKVRSYDQEKPCRGDVVCFRAPGVGNMVIHRVMSVRPEGLITRGDNSSYNDIDVVPLSAVVGKVEAIRKGKDKALRVRGGKCGMLYHTYARLFCMFRMRAGGMYRSILLSNFLLGCLQIFAPPRASFKFVYFGSTPLGQMKILLRDTCIGHYLRGAWHISFPWRLWVDPAKIQSASQQVKLAEAQWLKTFEAIQQSTVHEPDGRNA